MMQFVSASPYKISLQEWCFVSMDEVMGNPVDIDPSTQVARKFVRHPADIPIQISAVDNTQANQVNLQNLSLGGLCCELSHAVPTGTSITIRVPLIDETYEGHGIVVWCTEKERKYDVGIQFLEEQEAFKNRMVEQICLIERYKQKVLLNEGRLLDGEQAAMEWIEKFAGEFAVRGDDTQDH